MNDDWRLQVTPKEHGLAHAIGERLSMADLEHDLQQAFSDRVVVSIDGEELFAYAGTRDQAERAATLIGKLAGEHGWDLTTELRHWHPTAEEWEDPDAPDAGPGEERAELMADEDAESAAQGYPDFEVRVTADSRQHAEQLADQLAADGLPTVRRDRYLLLGATDEDGAAALAERVRSLVPPKADVTVQGSGVKAYHEIFERNPFAFLGGLAG
jgi:hypothetical protein